MAEHPAWNKEVPGDRERETLLGSGDPVSTQAQQSWMRRWWPLGLVLTATLALATTVMIHMISGPRAPDEIFNEVNAALAEGRFEDAVSGLHEFRGPAKDISGESRVHQAEYHALAAAVIRARQDQSAGWQPANAERIINHLESAQKLNWILSPADWENLGQARVQVGEIAGAQAVVEMLLAQSDSESNTGVRDQNLPLKLLAVRKSLATHADAHPEMDADRRIVLFSGLRDDPEAMLDDLAWASACIAKVRLDQGDPAAASLGLHRDIRRLEARGGAASAKLLVLLGRAQRDLAHLETAEQTLRRGLQLASVADPVRGEAMVLLGDLEGLRGNLEQAHAWYVQAMESYPAGPGMIAAIMGRGRMADQLDDPLTALDDFSEVARRLARGDRHRDVTTTSLESVLLDRFESALTQGKTEHALELARLAAGLRSDDQRSSHVSTALAVAASQVAAERTAVLIEEADGLDEEVESARWSDIADLHEEAGESHLAAAIAIQQSGAPQDQWAESMYQAGVHLDAAGRQQDAASIFRDYVQARDERDPVRIDAMFRLAQALEAELSWEEAADWYDRLIEAHPQSAQATGSYVPSARSLLALGRIDEARCRLQSVIDGDTALRPGAIDYRDTLVMLGRMCSTAGEYPQAIGHLQEAADRWPDHPRTVAVLFDVASARRSLGVEISRRLLEETLAPSARQAMESDRLANLWEAAINYEQVVEILEEQTEPSDSFERMHRAAAIARADCLSETGRIREAIIGYEAIARKWPDHPAAMHALVEVASAWTVLDEPARAQAAHQRALARLQDLPDEVLNREDSFMDREVWERWMNTVPVGSGLFAGAPSEP